MTRPLHIFVPAAVRAIFERLAPRLETAAGAPVTRTIDLNPAIAKRIATGEPFDVALTNPPYIEDLLRAGLASNHRPFGRIPLAIGRAAVDDTAPLTAPPDIVTLLRGAETIAYTGAGTSGRTYLETIARMGLSQADADAIIARSLPLDSGAPAAAVASGKVTLAIAPLATLISSPGVTPAAIFPEDLGAMIHISVCLSPTPGRAAESILDFLTSPALDVELAAAGLTRFAFA